MPKRMIRAAVIGVACFALIAAASPVLAELLVYDEYDGRAGGTVGWAQDWPRNLKAVGGELAQTQGFYQRRFAQPVGKDGQALWIAITARSAAAPKLNANHSIMGLRDGRIHQQHGLQFDQRGDQGQTPFGGKTGIDATKKQTVLCKYAFAASAKKPGTFDITVSVWAGDGDGRGIDPAKPPVAAGVHSRTTVDRFYAGAQTGMKMFVDRVAVATSAAEALKEGPVPPLPFDISEKARAARKAVLAVDGRKTLAGENSPLRKGERISIFGDSVTDQGRYIKLIADAVSQGAKTRALGVKVHNRGINGGKVTDLIYGAKIFRDSQESFDAVLAADKPTVVAIYVGINDVMHNPGTAPGDFEAGLRHLVAKAQAAGAAVVLATPSVHNERPDGKNVNDKKIDAYADITRKVAADTSSTLVDLRKAFLAYLQNNNVTLDARGIASFKDKGVLTYDGVHPSAKGNELTADLLAAGIARAIQTGPQPKPQTIPPAPSRPPTAEEIQAAELKAELDLIAANAGLKELTGPDTPLKAGMKIDFFGDSVTWQGGYIKMMQRALDVSPKTKDLKVKLIKRGINGGKSTNLRDGCVKLYGCTQDPLAKVLATDAPAVAVIYIGINDVWHGKKGTTGEDFEACLKQLVSQALSAKVIPVLATLTTIGEKPDGTNGLDAKLDQYAEITRKVATETGTTLVDLRKVFITHLKQHNKKGADGQFPRKGVLTYDGVHMLPAGNDLLADQLSRGIVKALTKP